MDFNQNISLSMAKTMQHLSNFVFISNFTLARHDSCLNHPRFNIQKATLNTLRNAPLIMDTLFPDNVPKKEEEGIAQFENKGFYEKKKHFHSYEQVLTDKLGRVSAIEITRQVRADPPATPTDP